MGKQCSGEKTFFLLISLLCLGGPPRDAPTERPKLKLQPRSKPVEADTQSRSAIFGAAKPVDTTAREREIEARLQQEKEEEMRREEQERDKRRRLDRLKIFISVHCFKLT